MTSVIRLQALLIIILLFLSSGLHAGDEQYEDDKEIIEMLEMLEHYEIINSIDMYINMDDIENMKNEDNDTGKGVTEKEEEK